MLGRASSGRLCVYALPALPPKADIDRDGRNVRFVPKGDPLCAKKRHATRRTAQVRLFLHRLLWA